MSKTYNSIVFIALLLAVTGIKYEWFVSAWTADEILLFGIMFYVSQLVNKGYKLQVYKPPSSGGESNE